MNSTRKKIDINYSKYIPRSKSNIIINIIYLLVNIGLSVLYCYNTSSNIITTLSVVIPISILLINYILYIYNRDKFKLNRSYIVLSIFMSLSFIIPFYDSAHVPFYIALTFGLGAIFSLYILCELCGNILHCIKLKKHNNKLRWWDIPLFMIIPLAISSFALLGVYPGVSLFDTASCWSMVIRTSYSDAHPILYLMLLRSLFLIWDNIAIVSIFQILLISFTYAYTAYRLKELGLSNKLCYLFVFIVAIIPSNLLTNVQILKDIPYTMGLILLSIEIIRILTNKNYFMKFYNYLLLFAFSMLVICFRHNGVFVVLASFVVMILCLLKTPFRKHIVKVSILILTILFLFVSFRDYAINNVRRFWSDEPNSYGAFTIPVQGLVEVYANHYDEMDLVEKGILTKYLNEDFAQEYITSKKDNNFWQFHALYQRALDYDIMKTNEIDFIKTYLHYLRKYPQDIIISYFRITGITWSIPEYNHTSYPSLDSFYNEGKDMYMPIQDIKSEISRDTLNTLYTTTQSNIGKVIFWRPAFIMAFLILLVLNDKKNIILYAILPTIFNHAGYLFIIQAQDHRYFYVCYTILFITLILKFLGTENYYFKNNNSMFDIYLPSEQSEKLQEIAEKNNKQSEQMILEYIDDGIKKDIDKT